jgi:hypothetical protein
MVDRNSRSIYWWRAIGGWRLSFNANNLARRSSSWRRSSGCYKMRLDIGGIKVWILKNCLSMADI